MNLEWVQLEDYIKMQFYYEGNSLKSGIYEIRNRLSNKSYIG